MSNRQGVAYDADNLVTLTPGSLTFNGTTYDIAASGSAAAALQAALIAQATANAALPKAGGTMTGAINMSNQQINMLGAPLVSTDAATKGYVDTSVVGLLDLQGTIDCSTNPNYPAANKGDVWVVSVAGLIGGGAGISVQAGDALVALADNPGGTQAAVGSSWSILQANLVGALLAVNNLSDVQSVATARNNLGLGTAATQNSTAFATAAQGTLASTAVQRAGDTMTGNLLMSGAKIGVGNLSPAVALQVSGTTTTDIIRSDIGYDINPVLAPTTLSGVVLAVAGNVDIGNHRYYVTFVTALGETQFYFGPGNTGVSLTTSAGNQQVRLTIPVSSDYRVTSRRIYRSKVGGNYWDAYLVATIANNVTTTYDDNIADSALGATTQFFRENTTTKYFTQNGIGFLLASNQNTAFGVDTLSNIYNNTILGAENTVFGNSAGKSITAGTKNVIIGHKTGQSVSTAADAILIGHSAAFNGNPSTSVFIGRNVGYASTASGNVFVGNYSGSNNTTGGNNTYLGNNTGTATTTGGNNTCIGVNAGNNLNTGSYNIIIGNWILSPAANSVGILNIGNTIFGTGMFSGWPPSATPTNGSIAIGIQTPLARLHLPAGTAAANTAALKFASGINLTTPEAGAMEYNGTLSFTDSGAVRKDVALKTTYTPSLTPAAVSAGAPAEQTFTVTGLATTDTVTVNAPGAAVFSARVSAANTLAITFTPPAAGSYTPPAGTYRIVAIRS